jgi:multicomponent Na+:H+ antiporter subunit B
MKIVNYTLLIIFLVLLLYASTGLFYRGDLKAWVNRDESPAHSPNAAAYYIQRAYRDTHSPNMVTAILADYRGYDTLGEETVILTAGIICFLLLRRERKNKKKVRQDKEK